MILLGGYQETETMTLEKMVQLTGGCFLPDYRRLLQPIRKFRAAVYAVVGMLRMQYMVNRWRSGQRVAGGGRRSQPKPQARGRPMPGPSKQRSTSRSTSRNQPPPSKPKATPAARSPPSRKKSSKAVLTRNAPSRKQPSPTRERPSPTRERPEAVEEPLGASGSGSRSPTAVLGEDVHVEFNVEDEVTPRGQSSVDTDALLDEGIDEDTAEEDDETLGSVSRSSAVLLQEGDCCEDSLTPTLPLSITSLSSSDSDCTKFFTDYGNHGLPDMEMECGTTGSMPNLIGFDVRSVATLSDVESEELEHYLAQFDSLLTCQGYSSQLSSSTATSHTQRNNR
ncbi:uncharacterized protein LOC119109484 [Pollicipes pollicipes]|uniref:uncharacterized protein LOC119109484 n=1 Tax=Pollicipes pollicipes TaxID=41117 RepID=UPI0018853E5A|nr:uncharacterized protein LOC119109484 [Pollicipes pollicipes]